MLWSSDVCSIYHLCCSHLFFNGVLLFYAHAGVCRVFWRVQSLSRVFLPHLFFHGALLPCVYTGVGRVVSPRRYAPHHWQRRQNRKSLVSI